MDRPTLAILKKIDRAEAAVWSSLEIACRAYATGLRGRPLVDKHFTAGNDARYGFAPLSRAYFLSKQRGIVAHRGAHFFLDGREMAVHAAMVAQGGAPAAKAYLDRLLATRRGSRLAKAALFRSSTGTVTGEGAGRNLPTLVRTGALRQAVTSKNATIRIDRMRGLAVITFNGLPKYAKWLHEGTDKMPPRSPVEPCPADIAEMRAIAAQAYRDQTGLARGNPAAA